MENEALEKYAKRWVDEIIEKSLGYFSPDNEPLQESRPLIEEILHERGYRAEFSRHKGEPLCIRWSEIPDDERDEKIGVEPW